MHPLRRDLLEVEHRRGDQAGIAGEGAADVHLAVVGDQHELVAPAELLADEGPDLAHHPVAVERPEVEVVDVDDQPQPLVLRRLHQLASGARERRRSAGRRRNAGAACASSAAGVVGLAGVDGVEVGDLHRPVVLEELEVVLGQAADGVALLVGDVDVDVDDADVDRVDERAPPAAAGLAGSFRRLGLRARARPGPRPRTSSSPKATKRRCDDFINLFFLDFVRRRLYGSGR